MTGRVKWFNNEKGYGFIETENKEDIFIHYSNINITGYKSLKENQMVEFEMIETDKGYQAKNIKPIEDYQTIN